MENVTIFINGRVIRLKDHGILNAWEGGGEVYDVHTKLWTKTFKAIVYWRTRHKSQRWC